MPDVTLRNSVDAWVSADRAGRFGDTRLYVHSTANAYIFFARPTLPPNAIVTSAKLRVMPGTASGSSSVTVALHHLTSAFDPNTLAWTSLPTYAGQVSSITRVWNGSIMEFDVTSEMQSIIDGATWFGWRMSSTSTDSTQYIMSGQSTNPMELVISYQAPPSVPTNLYPDNNSIVNDPKPTLGWSTPGGITGTQVSIKVQVATDSNFTSGVYNSNEIFTTASSIDLDVIAPAFTAVPANASRYWRIMVKNDMNVWSAWSKAAQFTYKSGYTVTITAPDITTPDPTPDIVWTYSGTQVAYQVTVNWVSKGSSQLVYDSGLKYGNTNFMTLPVGVVDNVAKTYRILVKVWSDQQPVTVTGSPSYDQVTKDFTWVPQGAQAPTDLVVTDASYPLPSKLIRWQYTGATAAERFYVVRYRYGEAEATFMIPAAEAREGATNWYRLVDRLPAGRADVTYAVMTVYANGQSSQFNPAVTIKMNHKMPWIQSVYDEQKSFCLTNYEIDPGLSEISDVVTPLGGAPYLALYALQKYNGTAKGRISWAAVENMAVWLSGESMKRSFLWLRQNPRVYITWQDQAIEAFIYGCSLTPVGTADGKTDYIVSFNFVQV